MKKLMSILLMVIVTIGVLTNIADAKRFGGGKSFGIQRSASNFSSYARSKIPLQQPLKKSSFSRWLGPIAGFAAGGLLASLLMSHGVGSGILSWLLVAGFGLLLWNLFRNKVQTATQPPLNQTYQNENVIPYQNLSSNFNNDNNTVNFDSATFLRDAKVQFIRLQAAYDNKDLNDLREFTAPEVYGEIQMQLQERGQEINHTEVLNLEAEILDVQNDSHSTLVSVKFSGLIKETSTDNPMPFTETWHFRKDQYQSKWLVAGVQQILN